MPQHDDYNQDRHISLGQINNHPSSSPTPTSSGRADTESVPTPNKSTKRRSTPSHNGSKFRRILDHRWFSWIEPKLTWPALKPVLRTAVSAWLGLLVLLILPSQRALGNAAFFLLIVSFMLPPSQPFIQNLEVLANLYTFTGIAWAWVALGVFVAHKVRSPVNPDVIAQAQTKWAHYRNNPALFEMHLVYNATYLEANSAIVCAVFLCVGTGGFLWYKMRTQPSPATFPLVLSCVLMDIGFTTAALYPYPLYTSGLLFFLPMAVSGGISVVCSLVIYPESVGHSFQSKLVAVIQPLAMALESVEDLFEDNLETSSQQLDTEDRLRQFAQKSTAIRQQFLKSLAGVPPLRAQQRYLKVDFSFGRLSSLDLRDLFELIAILQARSGGMAFFFDVIVTNAEHLHLDSSAFSVHHAQSRPNSRPASVRYSVDATAADQHESEAEESHHRRLHLPAFVHRLSGSPLNHSNKGSHVSLLDHLRKTQLPVGVYESQRYMDVERAFSNDTEHIVEQLCLLSDAALPLVKCCRASLASAVRWIDACNRQRHHRGHSDLAIDDAIASLQGALDDFQTARLLAIKPYRHVFDPAHQPSEGVNYRNLKHRGLFQVFVAHYHLIEFSGSLLQLLRSLENFDATRTRRKFWYPRLQILLRHIRSSHTDSKHLTEEGDDEGNGDFATDEDELGEAKKRDPDHTPFESPGMNALARIASLPDILRTRSFAFALKAGILTALTTLPQFIASSAAWYYYNRGIWVAIMAQLTLAMYSGDTTAAWLGRCVASFWGATLGMIAWYIGCGSGSGNAYGLAAISAVTFPIAMFFRIYFPGPILTAVMTPVTFGLVIGYSYLNGTGVQLTAATWGFDVAWRRFVCVLIGITAAWIFSYVPPVYSAKRAIRQSYATAISASGTILCEIITHANDHHHHLTENIESRKRLLFWRSKINKLGTRHTNAQYEYSLAGRWPEERYKALQDTLQDLFSLLSQLNHVLAQLERPWRRALLRRTRLDDPAFIGDILAPLPQITPSPLVARFREGKIRGLEISHDASEHNGELPSLVTVDVLESEGYMRFALGTTTTFSILSRLDRIVVICKTLLGENYHIGGLHLDAQEI